MVFKEVHEPIIDRETFEQVQNLTKTTKRRVPKSKDPPRICLPPYFAVPTAKTFRFLAT